MYVNIFHVREKDHLFEIKNDQISIHSLFYYSLQLQIAYPSQNKRYTIPKMIIFFSQKDSPFAFGNWAIK